VRRRCSVSSTTRGLTVHWHKGLHRTADGWAWGRIEMTRVIGFNPLNPSFVWDGLRSRMIVFRTRDEGTDVWIGDLSTTPGTWREFEPERGVPGALTENETVLYDPERSVLHVIGGEGGAERDLRTVDRD